MRYFLMAASVLALAACGKADDGAPTANAGAAGGAECSVAKLPLTGLCGDADPSTFLAIDSSLDTVARGCVWRTEELQTKDNEALVFRAQDCTGEMWDKIAYAWVDRYVKSHSVAVPADQAIFVLEVLPVPEGETAEQVALKTLAQAPEDQRTRCEIKPYDGPKVVGRSFTIFPNVELKAELDAASLDEPWMACGPNGVSIDGAQFWEGREKRALFHMVGQDQPMWDPARFTFYAKGADGRWFGLGAWRFGRSCDGGRSLARRLRRPDTRPPG